MKRTAENGALSEFEALDRLIERVFRVHREVDAIENALLEALEANVVRRRLLARGRPATGKDAVMQTGREIARLLAPPPEGAALIRELCRIANTPPGPFISAGASAGQVFGLLFRDMPPDKVKPLTEVREILRIMQARCSGCMSCTLRT